MSVTDWRAIAYPHPNALGVQAGDIGLRVVISVCFPGTPCPPVTGWEDVPPVDAVQVEQVWRPAGAAGYRLNAEFEAGPRSPWVAFADQPALTARVGARITVAAPHGAGTDLVAWMTAAERAVAHAERFVVRDARPARYLIYVADADAWRRWHPPLARAGHLGDFHSARSLLTRTIYINGPRVAESYREAVLRHEVGHAVTLGPS